MRVYSKVIFCDIDGVLLPIGEDPDRFNSNCVENFNGILYATDAEIVITSTWRELFSLEALGEIFAENDIVKLPVDATPIIPYKTRKDEIVAFLKENPVYKFVVLDDSPDAFVHSFDEFILIEDPAKGLTSKEAKKAIELLNG